MSPRTTAKFASIFCATAAISMAVTPAFAGSDSNRTTRQIEVSYADLDLSNAQGVARLETRVKMAARKACGSASTRDLADIADYNRCIAEARSSGQKSAKVAVANARNGGRLAARDATVMVGN